jgi:hypothetical protein
MFSAGSAAPLGLLKGCAEQNALCAMAAAGVPFRHARALAVLRVELTAHYAAHPSEGNLLAAGWLPSSPPTGGRVVLAPPRISDALDTGVPCGACRHYLRFVRDAVTNAHRHHGSAEDAHRTIAHEDIANAAVVPELQVFVGSAAQQIHRESSGDASGAATRLQDATLSLDGWTARLFEHRGVRSLTQM